MIRNLILSSLFLSISLTAYVWAQPGERSAEILTDIISSSGLDAIRPYLVSLKGRVVKVSGASVYIANETGGIVQKGMRLEIVRDIETITHPVTGETLGVITEAVGKVEVVSSDEKLIVTAPVQGGGKIKTGDSIAKSMSQNPRVAMAAFLKLETWDKASAARALSRKISRWEGVSLIPNNLTERFIYDEGITGKELLISAETLGSIGKRLKADFLIVLDIKEQSGSILTDISLYRINDSRSPLATFSGIAPDPGKEYRAGAAKHRIKKARPVEKKQVVAPKQLSALQVGKTPAKRRQTAISGVQAKTRKLGRFKGRITAVHLADLDGDGKNEIIVGFNRKIVSYKLSKEGLTKIWEKQLGSRGQILGLSSGDFNGNGEVEIYVNNAVASTVRSLILEGSGSSYRVIADRLSMLFFAGEDGNLYGQSQIDDFSLENKLMKLTWNGEELDKRLFLTLPENSRLTGFGFLDIDGDNVTDVAAYSGNHSLAYYLSSEGNWEHAAGDFGGSNVKIKLDKPYRPNIFQEFMGPVLFEPVSNGRYDIIAVRNKGTSMLASILPFTKARIAVLEYDGVRFVDKSETPLVNGAIISMALLPGAGGNLLIVARNYPSFFKRGSSELILLNRDSY